MSTIPVYLFTVEDDHVPFMDAPASDLELPIRLLGEWGLSDGSGNRLDSRDVGGDFVVHEGRVVFRISAESQA